jgi:hypothetical protein
MKKTDRVHKTKNTKNIISFSNVCKNGYINVMIKADDQLTYLME